MSAAEQQATLGLPIPWRHPIRKLVMRVSWPLLRRQVAFNQQAASEIEAVRTRMEDALTGHHSSLARHDEVLARFDRERQAFEESVTTQVELFGRQAFARYHEGNGAIRRDLSDAIMHFTALTSDLERTFTAFMARVDGRLAAIEGAVSEDLAERARATGEQLAAFGADLARQRAGLDRALADQRMRLAAVDLFVSAVKRAQPEPPSAGALAAVPEASEIALSALEDALGASAPLLGERYRSHLDRVQDRIGLGPVLVLDPEDVGFAEVLGSAGAKVTVVTGHPARAERARLAGLSVETEDLRTYLAGLAPGSVGMVCALSLFERLGASEVLEILDLAARALAGGGTLVVECLDPDNVVAATSRLYEAVAPRRPLPRRSLAFLVESRGFVEVATCPVAPTAHPIALASEAAPWTKDLLPLVEVLNEHLLGPEYYLLTATRP